MIGCSAPFCNNSTAKGYILKIFPKNPERRAQWVANINVKDWTPTDRSYLCEVHFSPDMWEQRCDKKAKLKPNAVPTIFGYWLKEKTVFRQSEDPELLSIKIENEQCSVESTICDEEQSTTDTKQQLIDSTKTNENIDLKNENKKLKEVLDTQMKRVLRLQKQSKALTMKVRRMKDILDKNKYKKALKMMLNDDQIKSLCNKRRSVRNWSKETIQRALRLKLACGTLGYKELLRQNIPFPSLRTLRRKLEGFKFESGTSKEMIDFLKVKAFNFENDIDKECGLVVDKMSITQGHVFDPSTNTTLGDVTFPHNEGKATYALALMLMATGCRWKHVVKYYFTGNSFNSEILKEIIFQIIHMYEAIGLRVNYITSDMGSGNVGIWKFCESSVGQYSNVTSCIVCYVSALKISLFRVGCVQLVLNI